MYYNKTYKMKIYLRDLTACMGRQVYAGFQSKPFNMWHSDLPHHVINFKSKLEAEQEIKRIEKAAPVGMQFKWEILTEEQLRELSNY